MNVNIQNGIILDGVVYEFAPCEGKDNDCEECALHERCRKMRVDILCGVLFDNYENKAFKLRREV